MERNCIAVDLETGLFFGGNSFTARSVDEAYHLPSTTTKESFNWHWRRDRIAIIEF